MHRGRFLWVVGLLMLVLTPLSAVNSQTLRFDPTVCAEYNDGGELGDECLEMIEAFPRPPVQPIPQDRFTLSYYSFWRIGPEATPTYDVPDGRPLAGRLNQVRLRLKSRGQSRKAEGRNRSPPSLFCFFRNKL